MFVRNPWVWLRRFRHRCGYGIHSPFAYAFVSQVLYCPGHYYADARLYPLGERLRHPRRTTIRRLMFRLANYWQPEEICAPASLHDYLHAGCHQAHLTENDGNVVRMLGEKGRMDVYLGIDHDKATWLGVKENPDTVVTFDLYDVGIAFSDVDLKKQNYIINW